MIGNNYINTLYQCDDENLALNDLLNKLNKLKGDFIEYMENNVVEIDKLTDLEKTFVTKIACLIEYFYIQKDIQVPDWIIDERLCLAEPYVYGAREKDINFLKAILLAPPVFKSKNVYFDLNSLIRI